MKDLGAWKMTSLEEWMVRNFGKKLKVWEAGGGWEGGGGWRKREGGGGWRKGAGDGGTGVNWGKWKNMLIEKVLEKWGDVRDWVLVSMKNKSSIRRDKEVKA